ASVATGRAAFRWRAELVPYIAGHVLFALTAAHHAAAGALAHQQAVIIYAAPACGLAVLAYSVAQRSASRRNAIHLAVAIIGALLLGWSAWAVSTGPSWPTYVVMLVLVTAAGLAYWPWLASRRDPRHVEVTLPAHLVPDAKEIVDPFKPLGLSGATWVGAREAIPSGYRTVLALPLGKNGRQVADTKGPDIAHLLDVGVDDVELLEDPKRAARVTVLVHTRDLLEKPAPWPLRNAETTDLYDGIPLGRNRAGELITLDLIDRHLLIAGESGSGKSNVETIVAAAAALDPEVQLWGIDGKITELPAWRPRMTAYVDDNPRAALDLLGDLRKTMAARQRILRDQGHRTVRRGDGMGLIVLLIDELARFVLDVGGDLGPKFVTALLDVLQVARSVGVIVVANTQRPSGALLTGDLRAGFTWRLAMRMDSEGSRMTLNSGSGVDASTIDPTRKGLGYLAAGTSRPRLMRAFYVPDDDLGVLVAAAANVEPPTLPGVVLSPAVRDYDPTGNDTTHTPHELDDDMYEDTAPVMSSVTLLQRRFPDGQPIPSQELGLWDALGEHPDGATVENLQMNPRTGFSSRTPITDRLRVWTSAGYLERIEGRPQRFRRLDLDAREQTA
ncbi:MAG TPA: FtsK/SpoIIIE domain-containing protein, partial [Jiangellaceae bacterium]